MSAGTFDASAPLPALLSALASGTAVKLMDDFVDREEDARGGAVTWVGRLGDGVLPYAMAALCLALLIDAPLAGTLFMAAYALGMACDWERMLPTRLRGWHEALLAVALGALLAGPGRMAASLAALTFVQCADDLADVDEDVRLGRRSLAAMMGKVETGLLGAGALVVAAALAPLTTTAVIVATAAVSHVVEKLDAGGRAHGCGAESARGRWP